MTPYEAFCSWNQLQSSLVGVTLCSTSSSHLSNSSKKKGLVKTLQPISWARDASFFVQLAEMRATCLHLQFFFFWFSINLRPVMFGMFKSETIMSVHVWFSSHRHSGSICRGHMAGLENPNISYPRSSKISDNNLRMDLLSSMNTTLSLRSGFT